MEVTRDTKLTDLLEQYPWLKEEAMKMSDKAKMIDTPIGRMMIKKMTVADLCKKADLPEDEAIAMITRLIETYESAQE